MEVQHLGCATLRERKQMSATWCILKQRAAHACIETLAPVDASDTLACHEENHQELIEYKF
jgi:hypothetical protein